MAGTGKTVLARKVARLECERGKKVLLLTFNALIAEQIRQDLGLLAGLTVSHLHDHLRVITRAGGGIVGETDTDHFNKVSLPSQACEALLQYETNRWVYDTLVVDEAQDLVSPHYLDFLDLSLTGGLKSGRWLLFGDFERQSIYTDEIEEVGTETDQGPAVAPEHSVLAHMENLGTSVFYHDLSLNCRNSPTLELPIAKLGCLDPFYSGFRRQDREASFGLLFYKDEEDQVELLRRELERLEKAGFQGADIVVLSPTRSSAAARLDPHLSRYTITPDRRGPTYTTVHRFKGLEAKAVVLTDIDHMDTQRDLDLLYIGLTRPLHWVTVLMSERLRDVAKRSGLTG